MTFRGHGSGGVVRAPTLADADFSVVATQRDTVVTPGGTAQRTADDALLQDDTSATVDRVSDVAATEVVPGTFKGAPAYECLDPAVATIDDNGRMTKVGSGTARVIVRTRWLARRVDVAVASVGGQTVTTLVNFVAGSLARHCADAVDGRIAGKTFAASAPLYTTQNHAAGVYARNPSFWAADVDLTCVSPWNSSGGALQAGTLVSPRHLVHSEHYPYGVGASVRFIKADGSIVTRTVAAVANVGAANGSDNYATDVRVALLDSDVPAGISFAKVLPSDYADYLPGLSWGIPGLCLDQEEKGLVSELYELSAGAARFRYPPTSSDRRAFYEHLVSGDSGNPGFLIIGGEPVLVTTWTWGGAGAGPNYADIAGQINATMTTLGGGYQLTEADLSGFPAY